MKIKIHELLVFQMKSFCKYILECYSCRNTNFPLGTFKRVHNNQFINIENLRS